MHHQYFLIIFSLFIFSFLSCREKAPIETTVHLGTHNTVIFLDSTQAAAFIIQDEDEDFFDNISSLDMMIQMKKNYPADVSRNTILKEYKEFLQKDVQSFSRDEITLLERVWKKAYEDCNALNEGFFPDSIFLIKTPAEHYGPSVYYTRERGVIIPSNELVSGFEEGLYQVMLHELFHIWSRMHPQQRLELYQLVGFQKLPVSTQELQMEEALRHRILLNPDGIDYSYSIRLRKEDGSSLEAIPIIQANRDRYTPDQASFFEYLSFQLFPIEKRANGQYQVISQSNGDPIENLISSTNFLQIITDNTAYIIHPDEIMADNFVIWVNRKSNKKGNPQELSSQGEQLLERIGKILLE